MTNTTDTETEANRQLMTETFEAWRDGAEPFPDTWATDMVWRIEGHSIASKNTPASTSISKSSSNPSARAS
jgi:ketosteroid isomerase-like protein